ANYSDQAHGRRASRVEQERRRGEGVVWGDWDVGRRASEVLCTTVMSGKFLDFLRVYFPSLKPDYDPFPAYRRRIALDHVRRGNQFWEKHQFDHAIGAYTEAIELNPNLAEAFCNRSGVLLENANYNRALEDCNQAINVNPHLAEAFCNR